MRCVLKPTSFVTPVRHFDIVSSYARSALDGGPTGFHHKPACLFQSKGNVLGSGLCLLCLQDASMFWNLAGTRRAVEPNLPTLLRKCFGFLCLASLFPSTIFLYKVLDIIELACPLTNLSHPWGRGCGKGRGVASTPPTPPARHGSTEITIQNGGVVSTPY